MDDERRLKLRENARKNVKHRQNAFENRGPDALTTPQRAYYLEIREKFRSAPARLEYREELAAALAMLCELGFSDIREKAEKGADIWQSGVVSRLGTYINSLCRLLDNWPKDTGEAKNVIDLLKPKEKEAQDE
ncbi:MAG: hypothetical protein WAV05_07070 [Anaerolineales bacterium]